MSVEFVVLRVRAGPLLNRQLDLAKKSVVHLEESDGTVIHSETELRVDKHISTMVLVPWF